MKKILAYSVLAMIILIVLFIWKNNTNNKQAPITESNKIRYYYHEQNIFNFTNRCDLDIAKIINTDTIIFVSISEYSGTYEECRGKLIKINDSIYQVKSFRYIEQVCEMPLLDATDSLSFYCDSSLIGNNFKIQYPNKKIETYKIRATLNRFPIDKKQFNSKKTDMLVLFDYQHPIINEIIELKASHHSDFRFKCNENPDVFYVVIHEESIKTLNTDLHFHRTNSPKFMLEKMATANRLNSGRRLR
jgi:hypothetical protein